MGKKRRKLVLGATFIHPQRQGLVHGLHSCKAYTGGQLTGYMPVNMRCRTRHGITDGRTDNMQLLVWPVHRTFARQ